MTDQGTAQRTVSRRDQQDGDVRDPGRLAASTCSDRFGRFAMRALQVLIVAALAVAGLYLVGVLRLLVVPVLLVLLVLGVFAPLCALFHDRLHLPQSLAAVASLLLALLALGGV